MKLNLNANDCDKQTGLVTLMHYHHSDSGKGKLSFWSEQMYFV